jgi:hypothetical protein
MPDLAQRFLCDIEFDGSKPAHLARPPKQTARKDEIRPPRPDERGANIGEAVDPPTEQAERFIKCGRTVRGSIAAIEWCSTTRGRYRIPIARSSLFPGPACALTFC